MISLCNHWEFIRNWNDAFAQGAGSGEAVRLPHTVQELPLHYADHESYQMVCGYRRTLEVTEQMQGKRLFLQFDGAGHIATVYVNGREAGHHRTGYTAFRVEITDFAHVGDNLIAAGFGLDLIGLKMFIRKADHHFPCLISQWSTPLQELSQ